MCGRNCSVRSAYCLLWLEVGNQPGLCNGDFIQWRKKLVSLLPCALRQSRQILRASVKRWVPAAVDLLSEQEGADSDDGDACPMYHGGEPVGPWLVNTKTGWSHRTVSGSDAGVVSDGLRWGLACRPAASLGSWFEFRLTDPELEGFSACGHSGCLAGNTSGP